MGTPVQKFDTKSIRYGSKYNPFGVKTSGADMAKETDTNANIKIAVAMRAVRAAMGYNQVQFAELLGVSKPTIARIETLELPMRVEMYANLLKVLKEMGITVDTFYTDSIHIEINPNAIELLKEKLMDDDRRRIDRTHKGVKLLGSQGSGTSKRTKK